MPLALGACYIPQSWVGPLKSDEGTGTGSIGQKFGTARSGSNSESPFTRKTFLFPSLIADLHTWIVGGNSHFNIALDIELLATVNCHYFLEVNDAMLT